jgi:hypothetical protein
LRLAKSRWYILEHDCQSVLWASLAGPVLGWILWGTGVTWKLITGVPEVLRQAGLLPSPPGAILDENGRGAAVLFLIAGGAVLFFSALALYAWWVLLRAIARLAAGEEHDFNRQSDALLFQGRMRARLSDVESVQVREHSRPTDESHVTWYNLILITRDGRRLTLASDDEHGLTLLAQGISRFLGVAALET